MEAGYSFATRISTRTSKLAGVRQRRSSFSPPPSSTGGALHDPCALRQPAPIVLHKMARTTTDPKPNLMALCLSVSDVRFLDYLAFSRELLRQSLRTHRRRMTNEVRPTRGGSRNGQCLQQGHQKPTKLVGWMDRPERPTPR